MSPDVHPQGTAASWLAGHHELVTARRRLLSVPLSICFGGFALVGLSGVAAGKNPSDRIFGLALLLVGACLSVRAWRMATVIAREEVVLVRGLWKTHRFRRSDLASFRTIPRVGGLARAGFALAAVFHDGSTWVLAGWWTGREGRGVMSETLAALNEWLSSDRSV